MRTSSTPDLKTSINRLTSLALTINSSSAELSAVLDHRLLERADLPSSLDSLSAVPAESNKCSRTRVKHSCLNSSFSLSPDSSSASISCTQRVSRMPTIVAADSVTRLGTGGSEGTGAGAAVVEDPSRDSRGLTFRPRRS